MLITVAVGILVVGSLAASLGNELQDIAIGCIVVIIVMAVALPVGARAWRRHFPAWRIDQSMVAVWPHIELRRQSSLRSCQAAMGQAALGTVRPYEHTGTKSSQRFQDVVAT